MTIRMYSEEKDKFGDIHPDEVENMKRAGWSVVSDEGSASDAREEAFTGTKHTGSGWYEIWVNGVQVGDNVRGQDAANAALKAAQEA